MSSQNLKWRESVTKTMNIKKYRAATTREALEQIKQDLGQDALVLETRQIRKGGFLGLGSEMQIEISAAATPRIPVVKPRSGTSGEKHRHLNSLHLSDNALAVPQPGKEVNKLLNGIKMRHTAEKFSAANSVANSPKILGTEPHISFSPVESVEINPSAPRVVHSKKEPLQEAADELKAAQKKPVVTSATTAASREFEFLRAELREVKFSLGSLVSGRNVQHGQSELNMEKFGEVFDSPFFESYTDLTSRGVSTELACRIISDIIPQYKTGAVNHTQISRSSLLQFVEQKVKFESNPLESEEPIILAVIGATGVGKTTTIAKLAAQMALHKRRRVELITLDTYRIAAVEQLKTYAEIIGAGCHVVRSILEMEATLRRMPPDADVFIDTTGKNPHDLADQYEVSEYLTRHTEIRKCLAIQATTHPLDGIPAIRKFEMYGADCLALTKVDETLRPGAMLELFAETALPLVFFSTGQRVPEDLQVAAPETLVSRILG